MSDSQNREAERKQLLQMTVDIVSAYVGNNAVAAGQVPEVMREVHASLQSLSGEPTEPEAPKRAPAVSVRRSVRPDHIVCLEDGAKLKMLKRHLRAEHGMSPEEYRAKWGLPTDYPMVAPDYAAKRSEFAKKIGLGRKRGESTGRRGRKAA